MSMPIRITDAERRMDNLCSAWYSQYEDEVEEFGQFLEQFPYLGAHHIIGRRIIESISRFPKTAVNREIWWRARAPTSAQRFLPRDLMPPPVEKATAEGRFNHYGQRVFYVASEPEAALLEVIDFEGGDAIGWIQQFQLASIHNILDLSPRFMDAKEQEDLPIIALGLIYHKLPDLTPDPKSPWKPEYFVPRFIADCAKQQGFAGIKFSSKKHLAENLVLFAWENDLVSPIGEPQLLCLPSTFSPYRIRYEL